MTNWLGSRYFWGGLIICAGVVLLLEALGLIDFGELLWAFLFGLGGIIFLSIFFSARDNWWAIIPSFALLSIAVLLGLTYFFPDNVDNWGGTIVLAGIGVSFFIIYLVDRNLWWAIIPGGVLVSIGFSVGIEPYITETTFIGIFFLGIGLTFGLVSILPSPQGNMKWALIPGGILSITGLILLFVSGDVFRIAASIILILLGIFIIYRVFRSSD